MPVAEIALYRSFLATDPGLVSVRVNLAQALLAAGRLDDAVAEASAALREDPSLTEAWLVRATARKAVCDYDAAIADFQRAAALAPLRASIMINLGNSYAELDRLGDAAHWLRRAVELAPNSKEAQANLGSVLVRLGEMTEAEGPCRAALALDPGMVQAHQNLSGILENSDPVAAKWHRDAAYGRQQIFVEPAAAPARTVLVLAAASSANVPLRHLMPRTRTSLIRWYIEYATPDQDRALPPCDLVFNGIGDPDLAPAIPPPAARLLRCGKIPILNHPERIAPTGRARLPELLAGIPDVLTPPALAHDGDFSRLVARIAATGMTYPVLCRARGSHGGEGLVKIDCPEDFGELPRIPGYVTQFVDFASPDGFFRKYRMIFVDGRVYPYHLAIADRWLVHYWTAGMEQDAARREEERRFLRDPTEALGEAAVTALDRIGERLALDYAGIDFSILADGRLVVFEANATMLVHPEHDPVLRYREPAIRAIQVAFDAMLSARMREPVSGG